MGYRVAAYLAPAGVDVRPLGDMERELAVRAWAHARPPLTVIEVWKKARKEPWPLSDTVNRYNPSPAVLEQLPAFAPLLEVLRDHGYGVPGVHGELNLGLEMSRLLGCRVSSFVTDDEEAACFGVSDAGRLVRVRVVRADLDLSWQGGDLDVHPLVPSDEDPEAADEILGKTAAGALSAIAGVRVHARERAWPNDLHGMVLEELRAELRHAEPILGLGTFDPPRDLGLVLKSVRADDGSMSNPTP